MIYKSEEYKQKLLELYDEKILSLNVEYEDLFVETSFGRTHILAVGKADLPPVVVLHGINAGAGLALEPIKNLAEKYRLYGVDSIGQAGKSAETKLSVADESYGRWLAEVFNKIGVEKVPVVGVSYGSFILGKLIAYQPERIAKAIFVVPINFANGSFFKSIFKLLLPMRKFLKTESDDDLLKFMDAYYTDKDDFSVLLQRNVLLGVKFDTRRPPLFKEKDAENFNASAYILAADDDIFAPAEKILKYAPKVLKNLKETKVLENSKHVPAKNRFKEIEETIAAWLED